MEFDINMIGECGKGLFVEVKKAQGGLPNSLWETYSAMANGQGGYILLGVGENEDGSLPIVGVKDAKTMIKNFYNTINNPQKVSRNLLSDNDVELYATKDGDVISIHVPAASRTEKPIYINGDFFTGTYRRNHDGDYRCSQSEVKAMLRDDAEESLDAKILDNLDAEALNPSTVEGYRNLFGTLRPQHVWTKLEDREFLELIGAIRVSRHDDKPHLTAAGLLMFGSEKDIVAEFPEYFLDYRETLDPAIRWNYRFCTNSGDWSGNLFDFYFEVNRRLRSGFDVPFTLKDGIGIDDTPVHKAVREALVNCLANADYALPRGIVIKKDEHQITMENPGSIRVGREQMLKGGVSDPRNKVLMKMFNLVGIGERAGSGVPGIISVWKSQNWLEPVVEEQFDPDRTILTLHIDRIDERKIAEFGEATDKAAYAKTQHHREKIVLFLKENGESGIAEISKFLKLSQPRARAIISNMEEVEALGQNKNRRYRLIDK